VTAVLDFAFSLKPDTIFLISDGSFQRGRGGENETVTGGELDGKIKDWKPGSPNQCRSISLVSA